MHFLSLLIVLLFVSCSYIPFQPKCERIPERLSYDGISKSFGRIEDYTRYNTVEGEAGKLDRFTYYYWETCGGESSFVLVHKRAFRRNSYGIPVPEGLDVYLNLIQMGVEEVKSE